jgi:oxazoline/thiazoline synthase
MPENRAWLLKNIDRLYNIDVGNDCPLKVVAGVLKPDAWGRRRVVSGRGVDIEAATLGCFFEAIERLSAVFSRDFSIVQASARELSGSTVDPRRLLQISDAQYKAKTQWNASVDADHWLPSPFDDVLNISWIEAKSLTSDETVLLPAAVCFLGYPDALKEGFPIPDSSGLASGQSVADATEKALLELVERDAVSMWWYSRARRPALDAGFTELDLWVPFSQWMSRCRRRFWLLDLTHDLAVPVAVAVSCDENGSDVSLGFGASFTPAKAAEQAMGELVQFEATKRNFSLNLSGQYPHLLSWCRSININDAPFLVPDGRSTQTMSNQLSRFDATLSMLKAAGLDAFVVDFSQPDIGAISVRVVAPGLRSVWPRFAPGRLYDVPHALKWHSKVLQETELNPVPMLY